MRKKRVICPQKMRHVPKRFSWLDHRLVRENHIMGLSHSALALYLFLVTVSDADGLSYYSDGAVDRYLNMDIGLLRCSRRELQDAELIAYKRPLYQILGLDKPLEHDMPVKLPSVARDGEAVSIKDILNNIAGGVQ